MTGQPLQFDHYYKTEVPPDLMQAFLETDYKVQAGEPYVLRIGQASELLSNTHHQYRVSCSAFITPDNPTSSQVSPEENLAAYQELIAELDKRKLSWLPGTGQHPSGAWPAERSVLVLGLGRDGAAHLGARFGQDAVVWSDQDAVPRLLILRR